MDETISVRRLTPFQWFTQMLLLLGAGIMILPFIYMIGTSFKPSTEVLTWPPTLFATHPTWENYLTLTTIAPFPRFFLNSLIMSTASALGILATSTFAGYIFSKHRFPGRDLLFIIILATAMVPFETYLIPLYFLIKQRKLINTYAGMAGPYLIMSFGIFLMRQSMSSSIPDELLDAGRIDGCSEWRLFRQIALPLSKSAIGALGIFAFMQAWMAFIWPLILATQREMYTMEVGLSVFQQRFTIDYGSITAGSTVSILPVFIVFMVLRRNIIQGITLTGLKG
jgi:multiple sugar transport system permease protein